MRRQLARHNERVYQFLGGGMELVRSGGKRAPDRCGVGDGRNDFILRSCELSPPVSVRRYWCTGTHGFARGCAQLWVAGTGYQMRLGVVS